MKMMRWLLVILGMVAAGCLSTPGGTEKTAFLDEPYLGPADAKVEVVEFASYGCLTCKMFHDGIFQELKKDYGDRVRIVYRHVPGGQVSLSAAMAAECAHEQGGFWPYHDLLFEKVREWTRDGSAFYRYAVEVGLEEAGFRECLDSGRYREEVLDDLRAAREMGIIGTPTLYINGRKVPNTKGYPYIKGVIEEELEKK
jgi:protein-disulfide isomerase